MRCEVCGRKINGKPYDVIIEGAKLIACNECSRLGKIYHAPPRPRITSPKSKMTTPLRSPTKKPSVPQVDTTLELIENYDVKIRQAREKMGLTHEDLGKRINEKVSLLRKIETGKMTPDNRLAATLEHVLKIKLIVPAKEEKASQLKATKTGPRELTLGDLIQLDGKTEKTEDTTGRKQS